MRLRNVVLTASLFGFATLSNVPSEAGGLLFWNSDKSCDGVRCAEDSCDEGGCKFWSYHYWHDKSMQKRKERRHAIHQWQRWFVNPVVTPDATCNYGYFETQWRRAPAQFCPQPGAVYEQATPTRSPEVPSAPEAPTTQAHAPAQMPLPVLKFEQPADSGERFLPPRTSQIVTQPKSVEVIANRTAPRFLLISKREERDQLHRPHGTALVLKPIVPQDNQAVVALADRIVLEETIHQEPQPNRIRLASAIVQESESQQVSHAVAAFAERESSVDFNSGFVRPVAYFESNGSANVTQRRPLTERPLLAIRNTLTRLGVFVE